MLTVVKFAQHGNVRWLTRIEPRASRVAALALDAAGDVYVSGALGGYDETYFGRFAVVKLAGSDASSPGRARISPHRSAVSRSRSCAKRTAL